MRLRGVNDEHLKTTLAQAEAPLRRRSQPPRAVDRLSRSRSASRSRQRGRHKKQSGGHGQFGDVIIEIRPLARGDGFQFEEKIHGGAIPKQWIPAVEQGVKDAMQKGPLGFPVVDVAVTLVDGSYHSVDSSELAFRLAGRIAMQEALAAGRAAPARAGAEAGRRHARHRRPAASPRRSPAGAGRCSAWARAKAGPDGTGSRR